MHQSLVGGFCICVSDPIEIAENDQMKKDGLGLKVGYILHLINVLTMIFCSSLHN